MNGKEEITLMAEYQTLAHGWCGYLIICFNVLRLEGQNISFEIALGIIGTKSHFLYKL